MATETQAAGSAGVQTLEGGSLLDEILKDLFVPQRIHGAPEALVLEAQELISLDQPLERRLNQFLAFAHVVEDLRAEHKEAPVDPEVGIPARVNPVEIGRASCRERVL